MIEKSTHTKNTLYSIKPSLKVIISNSIIEKDYQINIQTDYFSHNIIIQNPLSLESYHLYKSTISRIQNEYNNNDISNQKQKMILLVEPILTT